MTRTVLLVDDEPILIESLRRSLRREDFRVLTACGAAEAFGLMHEHPVDVVVSDDEMPSIAGVEFFSQISHLFPTVVRIMLTGQASVSRVAQAVNEGSVFRFLTKPCPHQILVEALHHALDHKLLMDRSREAIIALRRQSVILRRIASRHPEVLAEAFKDGDAIDIQLKAEDFQNPQVLADELHIQIQTLQHPPPAAEPKQP